MLGVACTDRLGSGTDRSLGPAGWPALSAQQVLGQYALFQNKQTQKTPQNKTRRVVFDE